MPHWLIVGATRSGKSTLIHAIVVRLADQGVALVGIDLKGGLELAGVPAALVWLGDHAARGCGPTCGGAATRA
jgi:predicted AAA+ superfamily ATPase